MTLKLSNLTKQEYQSVQAADILILSNGPGEVTTWVRPLVRALRQHEDAPADRWASRALIRISVVLSPCPNATGQEAQIAQSYPEVDRVQGAEHFFPFLVWGKTAENWDWHDQGVVVFLGGDQFFPVIVGRRLGYRTVVYAEWEARWPRWLDRFGVMHPQLVAEAPPEYAHKLTVVGDLMADVAGGEAREDKKALENPHPPKIELIGLLPGSKAAKLTQGVPLCLAIAQHLHALRPQTRFVIPVAPTVDLATLARFADPAQNLLIRSLGWAEAELVMPTSTDERPFLKTASGLSVELWQEFPAHELLVQCHLCITTVGANTAELGALAVPMLVLLPTQQLDAMRSWDGVPGLLARLPGVGSGFAKIINGLILRQGRLFAWPNIWAKAEIVPELVGKLQPEAIAQLALNYLEQPEQLAQMRDRLRQVRGQPGAAQKLAQLVREELDQQPQN